MSLVAADLAGLVLLPIGLGLIGFLEPCSIGANMLLMGYLETRPAAERVRQILVFLATRALFIGALGALAAIAGSAFIDVQKLGWILLGLLYAGLGALYVTGRASVLMRTIGLRLPRLSGARGGAALGLVFGLNVPACAAPLLLAVLGAAAMDGSGRVARGFLSLSLFGLALTAPLVLAVAWQPARRALERLAARAVLRPRWIGAILILLGAWSVYFGLFVSILV